MTTLPERAMNPVPPGIYLASRSPRRRELLHQIGVHFDVLAFRGGERGEDADLDESPMDGEAAERYVERLALTKAEAGMRRLMWRKLPRQPVLAADTALAVDARIVGKPAGAEEAVRMLRGLSGRSHQVLTAVAMTDGGRTRSRISVSEVRFRSISEEEIRRYVDTGEPLDKAGGYGIQGRAAVFIEHISGSYSGIMGLPLFETTQLLDAFGYACL